MRRWDFAGVWGIGEHQSYPYLRRYLISDMNFDGIVDYLDASILSAQWLSEP